MNLFKSKIKTTYPDFLKALCKGNIEWYNTILGNDDSFPKHIHDQMCLTYFNISVASHFLINGNIWHNNGLPTNYKNVDISQIFTNSLFSAFIDYGYNEEQSQEFLNELDKFINVFNEYRNRFDEEALRTKDSNAHVLKGCSVNLIMDILIDEGLIDNNDSYRDMHSSVCQFINNIIVENKGAFNEIFNKCKII
jgi:hypothetical protein